MNFTGSRTTLSYRDYIMPEITDDSPHTETQAEINRRIEERFQLIEAAIAVKIRKIEESLAKLSNLKGQRQ